MPSEPRARGVSDLPVDEQLLAFADSILAQAADENVVRESESQAVLAFVLGESRYAIPLACCREIVRVGEVTRIPEAPGDVRGVFNLRGRVMPVIEIRHRVGLTWALPTPSSRLVVVEARGRLFALLVDRVLGISRISVADIDVDAGMAEGSAVAGRARVGDGILMLFNPDRILQLPRGEKP